MPAIVANEAQHSSYSACPAAAARKSDAATASRAQRRARWRTSTDELRPDLARAAAQYSTAALSGSPYAFAVS
jgi:hypothetical protein